jgi:cytidylate kinase
MKNYKIAISGELGSGKSLLSNMLMTVLGIEIISVGKIQRQLAQKYCMNTLEFNKYMETHPEIDEECDNMVTKYGNKESSLIFDSRLAWHFVPNSFKIHLLVDSTIAAKRIFNDDIRKNEKYNSIKEAKENIIERKKSETIRFNHQYDININDFNNYNLVIDTTYSSPEGIFEKVLEVFNKWKQNIVSNKLFFSPKSLIPTQNIREHSFQYTKEISESIKNHSYFEDSPVSIIKYFNSYFIYDGHKRTSAAIKNKYDIIPCELIGSEEFDLPIKQTVIEFLKDNYKLKNVYDWEAMHQFNFPEYFPEY